MFCVWYALQTAPFSRQMPESTFLYLLTSEITQNWSIFTAECFRLLVLSEARKRFDDKTKKNQPSEEHKKYDLWSCQKVTDALIYLLDNIYIRFGSKLYRQNVGIPMGTNRAPLVADLFLFCYERDFMKSLTKEKRYDLIQVIPFLLPLLTFALFINSDWKTVILSIFRRIKR